MENQKEFDEIQEKLAQLKNNFGIEFEDEIPIDYRMIEEEYGIDIKKMEEDMQNYTPTLPLRYQVINDDAIWPKYNYESDSGFDLHSVSDIVIPPFGRALVPTGLCFDIPDGYEMQVRTKSGLAINQGLMVLNSPGTVDNGYNGEVKAIIFNTNPHEVTIHEGMKVGQAVLTSVVNGKWVELIKVSEIKEKDRNSNGFGSTGI
jgi:dUTP pyrophosphatase